MNTSKRLMMNETKQIPEFIFSDSKRKTSAEKNREFNDIRIRVRAYVNHRYKKLPQDQKEELIRTVTLSRCVREKRGFEVTRCLGYYIGTNNLKMATLDISPERYSLLKIMIRLTHHSLIIPKNDKHEPGY